MDTKTFRNILISLFLIVFIWGWSVAHTRPVKASVVTATPSPAPQVIMDDSPRKYIMEVFGVYSDKAFELLQSPSCHENLYLDPLAINRNTDWGGVGEDVGIFQINNVYHPEVSYSCARDYKCNIDAAYKIFVKDGYNFSAWTCGRELGI